MIRVFPCDEFKAAFPIFASNPSVYPETAIQLAGNEAMHHITEPSHGMPMENCEDRKYALFLMTAHILVLNHKTDDDTAAGNTSAGGSVVKAVIGSVTHDGITEYFVDYHRTKPNSFTVDDWSYWLGQTEYGRRLLAYLDVQAPFIFLNTKRDRVRVLK